MMDDLGFTDQNYNGGIFNTPTLNEMATKGIKINYHYANPICSSSRTSLLAGRYSRNAGVPGLIYQQTAQHVNENLLFISDILKTNHYKTGFWGKWHLGYSSLKYLPFNRGFDTTIFLESGAAQYSSHLNCESWGVINHLADINDNNLQNQLQNKFTDGFCSYDLWDENYNKIENEIYSEKYFTENIINYIDEYNSNDPFFIYYAMQTPHWPFEDPPITYNECNTDIIGDRKPFCNALLYGDEMIDNIINSLKNNNLFDNTVIIFLSDNGPNPNWKNDIDLPKGYGQTLPLRGAKGSTFEGGIRTPAIIYGGFVENNCENNNMEYNEIVHISDWFSTIIYGIAGIAPNNNNLDIDSINLWPNICNNINNDINIRHEIIHFELNDINDLSEGYKASYVRTNEWKLVLNASISFVEFISNKYWVNYDNSYSIKPDIQIYSDMKDNGLYELFKSNCFDDYISMDNNNIFDEEMFKYNEIMLFKIINDKIEACNVAKQYPNIVNELMAKLSSNENINKYMKYNSQQVEFSKEGVLAQIESYDCKKEKTYHLSWEDIDKYSEDNDDIKALSWNNIFESYIDIVNNCNENEISFIQNVAEYDIILFKLMYLIWILLMLSMCFCCMRKIVKQKEDMKCVNINNELTPLIRIE